MTRIVIHTGMHKTGTSAIQNAYASQHLPDLSYFPWNGPNHTGLFITLFEDLDKMHEFHGFKAMGCTPEYMYSSREIWSAKIEEFIESSESQNFLFSAEGISGFHYNAIRRLADFCQTRFGEISVITYVRPPRSYMASAFQELIKGSDVKNFDIELFWPHYKAKISILQEVFGENIVTLRKYDPRAFIGNSLLADFSFHSKLPMPDGSEIKSNLSLSLEAVAALYLQRAMGDGFVSGFNDSHRKNERFIDSLKSLGETRLEFSSSLLDEANDLFPGDVAWMESQLGVSLDEPLNSAAISSERDLFSVALQSKEDIVELRNHYMEDSEPLEKPLDSLSNLASLLDTIRKHFYRDTHDNVKKEEVRMVDAAAENTDFGEDREARMKLAYAVFWAQERAKGIEGSDLSSKWKEVMSEKMLEADQIIFQLKQQGLTIKSL